MTKYLWKIPDSLKIALKDGKVIPFVGSGISRAVQRKNHNAELTFNPLFPSWGEYIEILANALDNRDKSVAAGYVRNCLKDNPPDYLGAMQVAFDKLGETDWDRLLDRHFDFGEDEAESQSLYLYHLIWQIAKNLIITTNIDRALQWTCPKPNEFKLLESQKKEFGKLNKEIPPKCPTVVYFHGHIDDKENIIFTKEQYKNFYEKKNNEAKLETLKTLLAQDTFLFLGFSLDDPYFLQQLQYFHEVYKGGADSFFVLIHKKEKDNPNIPEFVRKIVFEDYGEPLQDLLKQLVNIAKENDIKISEPENLASVGLPKPINTTSNLHRVVVETADEKQQKKISKGSNKKTNGNSTKNQSRNPVTSITILRKYWIIIPAIVLLAFGVGWYYYKYEAPIYRYAPPIDSIAVLPFQNNSSEPGTEFLSEGLTDSLTYRLRQLETLNVSPPSSVSRYKGKEPDAKQVGSETGMKSVMYGRLIRSGENIIVSVHLVNARDGSLIWGEEYNRKMSDVLATQREIATEIAEKLKLKLTGKDKEQLIKPYTNSNEAYLIFLDGRYYFAKRTKSDMFKGIEYFEKAVAIDGNFALAYATLADAYATMPGYSYLPPVEAFDKAKKAAQLALAKDPNLAEAHVAWASCLAVYDWNWKEAEQEFIKAIELNPKPFITHFRYGLLYLMPVGRSGEAISELEKAVEAERYSLVSGSNLAAVYIFAGEKELSLKQAKKIYEFDLNFTSGRYYLGLAYIANGMYTKAITLSEESLKTDPENQLYLRVAGIAYAKNSQPQEAERIIKKFEAIAKKQYVMSYLIANIYAALGNKDDAFKELDKSFDARDWDLHRLKVDPFMASLRDDPRFEERVKRLELPE